MNDAHVHHKSRYRKLKLGLGGATVAAAIIGVIVALPGVAQAATITSNSTGTNNGFFYSFWEQSSGGSMTLGSGSNYSLTYPSGAQNIVAGTGWNPGSSHTVSYSGSWSCGGNCYLSLYGWTTSPLVEYYIMDNYGDYNPGSGSGATRLGTVSSDGGVYDIYETTRTNQPSIQGTATFNQYWAIRESKRTGGTITTSNIFNAWKSLGLNLGSFNYQILATEGYQSSGSSNITVSDGGNPPPTTTTTTRSTPPPTTTSSGGGGGSGGCTATYSISSSWSGGFTAAVTVKNGSTARTGWDVKWSFANGQTITSIWNGVDSASGSSHSVTNAAFNGSLAAGASTSFGFNGSDSGTNTIPTLTCS
jgi:endo-1,4-beta-xylanase